MESSFYKRLKLKQDRIHLDSETSSAVKTAKSEIFMRGKEIFFGRGKFDLTTPKEVAILAHIPFPAFQDSKMADAVTPQPFPIAADIFSPLFKTQSRRPIFFSDNTVINGAKDNPAKWDSKIASHLPDQRLPSFVQRSTRIYHGRPPEAQPILHLGRSSLQMHKFMPMIDTQHTRMKENVSFSPRLIFVDRHHNSSRSFDVMKVKEDINSKEGVRSYPIGFEPSGLTASAQHCAPAQHFVDYELMADRVYDIIENRLRIEKERE